MTIEDIYDDDDDEVPQNRDSAESDEDGSAMGDEPSEQGPHPYTNLTEEQLKDWEAELDEDVEDPTKAAKDWRELRTQIKTHLKKNSRTMPLSQLNQYMILGNFFTLQIKGQHRIQASIEIARQWNQGHRGDGTFARRIRALARHYETFEKLPKEKRGGVRKARSWLHDEKVKKAVMEYLVNVPVGKVTSRQLARQVNDCIFPELGVHPKHPIVSHTTRCWLIRLGWRHTRIKKGVYEDGHNRADIVHYRDQDFLPQMLEYERRMAHYEGPELVRKAPDLRDGEKELIPLFHDESCFHANDRECVVSDLLFNIQHLSFP